MDNNYYSYVKGPKPHLLSIKIYWFIFFLLVILTGLTIVFNQIDFGSMSILITLLIATCKAALVLSIFMHLWFDNKIFVFMLISSLLLILVLITFSLLDINTRSWFDQQRANDLYRNEIIQEHQLENPNSPALRPGLQK